MLFTRATQYKRECAQPSQPPLPLLGAEDHACLPKTPTPSKKTRRRHLHCLNHQNKNKTTRPALISCINFLQHKQRLRQCHPQPCAHQPDFHPPISPATMLEMATTQIRRRPCPRSLLGRSKVHPLERHQRRRRLSSSHQLGKAAAPHTTHVPAPATAILDKSESLCIK